MAIKGLAEPFSLGEVDIFLDGQVTYVVIFNDLEAGH